MHADDPLTGDGRRLVARVLEDGRAQSHVAAESHLARTTVCTWVGVSCAGRRRWPTGPPGHIAVPTNSARRWWRGSTRCAETGSSRRG